MSHDMMVVKKRVIEYAETHDVEGVGSPEHRDLMANVEGDVSRILEEEGFIEL